jgi:UDP-GlcNAc:undecaprenyl-phosphate GlcNAc-1-phosphate transferase
MEARIYSSFLVSFIAALVVLRVLLSDRMHTLAVDLPNERSLHTKPIPRTGGIAIVLGGALGLLAGGGASSTGIWVGALALAAISFLDDRRGLPVRLRLGVQILAALSATSLLGFQGFNFWFALTLGSFAVVWMTNLYNFMDGSDGLAGGMAASGFGAYALAGALAGDAEITVASASLAAGSLAFLSSNYPPARIFMGDVGSTVLGFCAAVVGLRGVAVDAWPLWFPALVFLPFAADASVTLLRRAFRRERLSQAHREHYYQRMIRSGWSHTQMAKAAYAIMLACATTAVCALRREELFGWIALGAALCALGVLMLLVDGRWARHLGRTATPG